MISSSESRYSINSITPSQPSQLIRFKSTCASNTLKSKMSSTQMISKSSLVVSPPNGLPYQMKKNRHTNRSTRIQKFHFTMIFKDSRTHLRFPMKIHRMCLIYFWRSISRLKRLVLQVMLNTENISKIFVFSSKICRNMRRIS